MFRNLIFDGISLKTYGLYISGDAVYDSPERDVEMISIPGRNGTFALDKGRFNNIEVTYPAGVFSDSQTNFADKVSALRNQLASRTGYRRIEDEYHPDEYRMGVYRRGLEFDPVHYNEASEFDITFDCKPQRFLKTGDEPVTLGEWGETETKSGSIVSFDETGATAIKSLKVNIVPKQSGSGDPSPSNVRPISGWDSVDTNVSGKNLFKNRLASKTKNGITITVNADGSMNLNGTCTGWFFENLNYVDESTSFLPEGNYIFSGGATGCTFMVYADGTRQTMILSNAETSFSMPKNNASWVRLEINNGTVLNNVKVYPMIRPTALTDSTFVPYQNTTITTHLGQTVYGGVLDVVSGKLSLTYAMVDMGSLTWDGPYSGGSFRTKTLNATLKRPSTNADVPNSLCSKYKTEKWNSNTNYSLIIQPQNSTSYADNLWVKDTSITSLNDFRTAMNGVQLCYELATPAELILTPTEVNTLLGANNIWADAGTVEVEIGENPNVLVNPTLFESKPLLMVEGYGDINIDDQVISIDNVVIGDVLLSNGQQLQDTTTGTLADMVTVGVAEFDQAKVNTGDTITLKPTAYTINIAYNNLLPSEHVEAEVTNQSGVGESSGGALSRTTASYTVNMPAVLFTVGTSASVQHSASWIFRSVSIYGDYSETTFPMVFNIAYDGANKITITAKHWYQAGATVQTTGTTGDLTGYSTVLVDGTIYIDLDIGEAYWIKDGTVISANYTVHLGADLPTLKPGINNITYTTRITSLKIVPRWWKV